MRLDELQKCLQGLRQSVEKRTEIIDEADDFLAAAIQVAHIDDENNDDIVNGCAINFAKDKAQKALDEADIKAAQSGITVLAAYGLALIKTLKTVNRYTTAAQRLREIVEEKLESFNIEVL